MCRLAHARHGLCKDGHGARRWEGDLAEVGDNGNTVRVPLRRADVSGGKMNHQGLRTLPDDLRGPAPSKEGNVFYGNGFPTRPFGRRGTGNTD
eukprot:393338-Lingulodinium_polyedra.AAC.1